VITEESRSDAGVFLSRLLRLDPRAVVRIRPQEPTGRAEMWAMLPFGVLVVRTVGAEVDDDITVEAAGLLQTLTPTVTQDRSATAPQRRDQAWQWPLPPSGGRVVETLPATEIARVAAAASETLRTAAEHGVGGRAVGERVVRDALLDHVAIVVTGADGERIDVPQRLVQAVVRMGFLGQPSRMTSADDATKGEVLVTVRVSGQWTGLAASYGSAWFRPISQLHLR
jgi:hypothetical protein